MNNSHLVDPFAQSIITICIALFSVTACIIIATLIYHKERPFIHYHYKKITLFEYLFSEKFSPLWLRRSYNTATVVAWTAVVMLIVGELISKTS